VAPSLWSQAREASKTGSGRLLEEGGSAEQCSSLLLPERERRRRGQTLVPGSPPHGQKMRSAAAPVRG
jgi:hypothetical protein